MLNVDLDVRGRMRSRNGFNKLTAVAGGTVYQGVGRANSTQLYGTFLSGGFAVKMQAFTNAGGNAFTSGTLINNTYNMVPYGTSSNPSAGYGPSGTVGGSILRLTGGGFADVATGIANAGGQFVNVTPVDFRLMILKTSGVVNADSGSTILWSNPGAPETFVGTNFVSLDPYNGQVIAGVCNFANQTYVFKQDRFYVFTGTTTDAGGNPIFNYRTVNTGIGIPVCGPCDITCCAAADGVYFLGPDGIYKTTGGAPVKVSGAIDPIFGVGGPLPPYFQGEKFSYSNGTDSTFMTAYKNRIYISYMGTSITTRFLLVYDIPTQQWYFWGQSVNGIAPHPTLGNLFFAYAGLAAPTSTKDLGYFDSAVNTDAGTNITARYRSAYIDFDYSGRTIKRGYHGVEKTIRETMVDGMGTVNFRLAKQWVQPGALPAGVALTLGTSPQVQQSRDRRAVRGRSFSWQIDGTAPWTIEKLILNLLDIAEPTLQKSGV